MNLRAGSMIAVVALHAGAIAYALKPEPVAPVMPKTITIKASLLTTKAEQNLSEEAKPLPAAVKPKPKPQRTMIAAPAPKTAEPVAEAIAAEVPQSSNTDAESSDADFVEARGDANYLSNPAPEYPRLSRRMGEEGKVVLRVFVEKDGKPSQVNLHASSGFERLDQSALDAVRQWSFVPAKRGEENVASWVLVPITFNLRG